MSYEKHTWTTNEAITASKMNNIETGIEEASQSGGGGLTLIPVTYDSTETSFVFSMTAQQIKDGMMAGNIYGFVITSDMIPEGFSFLPVISLIYSVAENDSYLEISSGCSWSIGCYTLSDYPHIYIGD